MKKPTPQNNRLAALIFFGLLISSTPISPITIPEGIKGFTVTYGTWIETIISRSIFKDIFFPEDQEEYNKLQRLIITSERLSEEGNFSEGLSYLRRAEFFLEDMEKSMARRFGWTQKVYNAEEMRAWSEIARETKTMLAFLHISLMLQYEYLYMLNQSPKVEFFQYIQGAQKLYTDMDRSTKTYARIQNSFLPAYLSRTESSWNISLQNTTSVLSTDKMMEYIAQNSSDFSSSSGYWRRKFLKRSTILLARYGYPEKAQVLLDHLMDDRTDTLPVQVIFNLMVLNGRLSDAEKFIRDSVNTLNLAVIDNWGIYIGYKTRLLNLMLLQKKQDLYEVETDKLVARLDQFLQRIDLPSDIYEYLVYQRSNAVLNKDAIKSLQLQSAPIKTDIQITEFTPEEIRQKKLISDSYVQEETEIPETNEYFLFRNLQIGLESGDYEKSGKFFEKLKNNGKDSYLLTMADLLIRLKTGQKSTPEEWYQLWLNAIYSTMENPAELVISRTGIRMKIDLEAMLMDFLSKNPGIFTATDTGILLYSASMLSAWSNHVTSPPDYYGPVHFRQIYNYLSKWGFFIAEDAATTTLSARINLDELRKKPFCESPQNCWIIYPVKDKVYSFIKSNKSESWIVTDVTTESLINQTRDFYQAIEKNLQRPAIMAKLTDISRIFSQALEKLDTTEDTGDKTIHVLAFKQANLLPIELLLLPETETHIGDKFSFIRKLPMDQSYTALCPGQQCKEQQDLNDTTEAGYFLIGVGSTAPGFIIANPNIDELLDIESLFSQKKLLHESASIAANLVTFLEKPSNQVVHLAGEWKDINNIPVFVFQSKTNSLDLGSFRFMNHIPYIVFSKNKSLNFSHNNFFNWDKILTTFRYKNTNVIISSMALSPKEFRQAFFYDMYYKIVHKKLTWKEAFFSSLERTKKGFPKSVWPYLMVIYEP